MHGHLKPHKYISKPFTFSKLGRIKYSLVSEVESWPNLVGMVTSCFSSVKETLEFSNAQYRRPFIWILSVRRSWIASWSGESRHKSHLRWLLVGFCGNIQKKCMIDLMIFVSSSEKTPSFHMMESSVHQTLLSSHLLLIMLPNCLMY